MNRRDLLLAGAGAGVSALPACAPAKAEAPPFPLRKDVNLGNALEAPEEGQWGHRIADADLAAIAEAGFDGVRLPVRWDVHAALAPPFVLDPAFLERVAHIVEASLAFGLMVQLDMHHYEALNAAPDAEAPRFQELWRQIARRFAGAPAGLIFEPFNEPNGPAMTGRAITRLQAAALAAIRPLHPERLVVLGGGNWNSIDGLADWTPPPDPRIAVTVHYYEPYAFTHENADWLGAEAPRFGRAWGTRADIAAVQMHAARAAAWARTRGYALQLGEFGVYRGLPREQRLLWMRAVRQAFEAQGAAWCVWDYAGAFPISEAGAIAPDFRAALLE